ncbi:CU044_5270 family protein [Streptomyces sp. ME19-01-6]|uniref:CU044_5270 family protein n=1 Tax=Streptomyces sp. ME19-01-6 TaxID=3028686 RepID=UPI0029B1E10E|nr:CU044_5270 family protein [Streptomyces sp. ME19-01-6]MDX3226617.1 CU044_5270 family protein [Streptomyces sp. ME19-01-6]
MNDIPPLPERDLPPGRQRLLKEHLMREIRQPDAKTAGKPRRTWLRPAVAGPALAGALALAAVLGVAAVGLGDGGGARTEIAKDGKATYAFAPRAGADTKGGAARVLDRVATVAEKKKADDGIRDDQFVYTKSLVSFATVQDGKPTRLAPLHHREDWTSVDGTREGRTLEPGGNPPLDLPNDPDPAPGKPGYDQSTNYRHLQTLPTDPDAMLTWLYAHTGHDGEPKERDKNQDAFVLAGDLLRGMMPPKVSAALYRAVAKIPGVVVVPDAVDAAGRHGVAVARVDSYNPGQRDEWIFGEKTDEYLGTRTVALKSSHGVKAGQVTGTSAVLKRAVVDEVGRRP